MLMALDIAQTNETIAVIMGQIGQTYYIICPNLYFMGIGSNPRKACEDWTNQYMEFVRK